MTIKPLLLILITFITTGLLWSEGFRVPTQGADMLAVSGGRSVLVSGAQSSLHNPANLTGSDAIEVHSTLMTLSSNLNADLDLSSNLSGTSKVTVVPASFVSVPLPDEKWVFGLALYSPFGLSSDYDVSGSFAEQTLTSARYNAPFQSELLMISVNPSLAYQVNDKLSIAGGLQFSWGEVSLTQFYPALPGLTATEGISSVEGDGTGLGFNVALTYRIDDAHTVALTYRSPFDISFDGDTDITNELIAPGTSPRSDFSTEIDFPAIASAAYAWRINEQWTVATQLEWIQFSRYESLDIDLAGNTILLSSLGRESSPQNWRDTFTWGLVGQYHLHERWTLMGGYQYLETPVPDETFSTSVADTNQNVLTAGFTYRTPRHQVSVGYGYVFYDDRVIASNANPALNGVYTNSLHMLTLAYGHRF